MHTTPPSGACRRSTTKSLALTLLLLAAGPAGFAQSLDSFNPNPNDEVDALALQTDGKILLGGWFTALGAQPCSFLARVNADGTVDTNFFAGTDGPVYSMAVQEDGKIIVGGWFSAMNGDWRDFLGRLNPDGTLDTGFNPAANSTVYCLAQQADGKILVGGNFTTLGGQTHNRLARLNPDGSVDASFSPNANETIYCLAVQPDGKILVGGLFTTLNGLGRNYLGRLNSDGSTDTTFNPNAGNVVYTLAVQPNGRVVVGGWFSNLGGQDRANIARINPDGTLDPTFSTNPNSYVKSVVLQANGRLVVGGGFSKLSGATTDGCFNLGTLSSNGAFSTVAYIGTNFSMANSGVLSLAVQDDGRILDAGYYRHNVNALYRTNLARYNASVTASQSLAFDGSTILWLRGGSSPEVWRTTFDISTNGSDWIAVGAGTRTNGGWKRAGLAAPASATIRARGWVSGGGSSSWVVELIAQPPVITSQPTGRTNEVGTTATFSVQATGQGTLGYQWLKGGVPLGNGGNVSGVNTTTLTLTNVLTSDAGLFSVVVSNAYGRVTSSAARLVVVLDLAITNQPANLTNEAGTTATFVVGATGKGPIGYQWLKGGVPLSNGGNVAGANTPSLTLSSLVASDAGWFTAVATNVYGSVTSSAAWLAVVVDVAITNQPADRTNAIGTTATFAVGTAGPGTTTYQWRKNGVNLADGGSISGATSPLLSMGNVSGADAGGYSVAVSNSYGGAATSRTATLAVLDPLIISHPASRTNNAGSVATFTVQAASTLPCGCQWLKDSLPIGAPEYYSGGLPAVLTLALTNVLGADVGGYALVLTNVFGSVTSGVAVLTVVEPFITVPPASQNANGTGGTVTFSVSATGTPSLAYQWRKDGAPVASATSTHLQLTNVQTQDIGQYDVIVTSAFGSQTSAPAWLTVNMATRGNCFEPVLPWGYSSTGGLPKALALQANGGLISGGQWYCRASTGPIITNLYLYFLPRGSQVAFDRSLEIINAVAVQADGKMLIGGSFGGLPGGLGSCLARLAADGNPDSSYAPGFTFTNSESVNCLFLQPDGKAVVGGSFSTVGGQPRYNLCRLASDGTLDAGFFPGANGAVNSLAGQPDGKIIVGGSFTTLRDQPRSRIGRLYADGTMDTAFAPVVDGTVSVLVIQADGKVLVGGSFTTIAGQPRANIGRLNSDGTLDLAFNPGANDTVNSLAVLANGMVIVGGKFTAIGGQARNGIARFKADGSLDNTLNDNRGNTGEPVHALAVRADGKFWVGDNSVCLWSMPELATQSLLFDGTAITWLRGGASPEAWRTGFETSTDGTNWVELGAGARITGGWQLAVPSGLATNSQIRARGWTTGGQYNGSSWFVETVGAVNSQTAPQVRVPAAGGLGTNGFAFTITGLAGQVVVVEAATELVPPSLPGAVPPVGSHPLAASSENWTPIATNTIGFWPFYFSDPGAVSLPWRFYRARLQ